MPTLTEVYLRAGTSMLRYGMTADPYGEEVLDAAERWHLRTERPVTVVALYRPIEGGQMDLFTVDKR